MLPPVRTYAEGVLEIHTPKPHFFFTFYNHGIYSRVLKIGDIFSYPEQSLFAIEILIANNCKRFRWETLMNSQS
jgi:hypothetical protein